MLSEYDIRLVATQTHGRVLVREARGSPLGLLHGYMENADIQMQRLDAIPDASQWTLLSIQALHRFYRGRTNEVVASWMTRQDRDVAISDNIEYVNAALDVVPHDPSTRIVYAGFSQGVAMAFDRACGAGIPVPASSPSAATSRRSLLDPHATFPFVFLARGVRDEWLTAEKFRADLNALAARSGRVRACEFDGGHEWNDSVSVAAADFLQSV